jgi:heme A synthase
VRTLRRLALVTDLIAFVVVLFGSWTRINAAGLTCPSWPMCRHSFFPNMSGGTLWEWTHRLLAFLLLPLVGAIAYKAWRERSRSPFLVPASVLVLVLFLVQVGLGAATVDFDNAPFSVVLHWGTAMALIASLLALAVFADDEPWSTSAAADSLRSPSETRILRISGSSLRSARRGGALRLSVLLVTTVIVTFITMCIGAYVSSSGAGLACLSIPGCAGNVVVYSQGQIVQMLHRSAAALTLLFAVASFALAWARDASKRVRVAVSAGVGLVSLQVLLGLLNVALRLPTDLRELHAANAALVFLSFVAATLFAVLDTLVVPSPSTALFHSALKTGTDVEELA